MSMYTNWNNLCSDGFSHRCGSCGTCSACKYIADLMEADLSLHDIESFEVYIDKAISFIIKIDVLKDIIKRFKNSSAYVNSSEELRKKFETFVNYELDNIICYCGEKATSVATYEHKINSFEWSYDVCHGEKRYVCGESKCNNPIIETFLSWSLPHNMYLAQDFRIEDKDKLRKALNKYLDFLFSFKFEEKDSYNLLIDFQKYIGLSESAIKRGFRW